MATKVDHTNAFSRISEITEARILKHIRSLVGERHPETASAALKNAASYLVDQMQLAGLETAEGPIDHTGVSPYPNVIGRLKSAKSACGLRKALLVIGAHYDTVVGSPGADDNASGLAVLLEVARTVSGMEGNLLPEFVAFSMEEPGFIGSDYYVQEAERAERSIWGAIILECVGYTDHHPGSQQVPPGIPIPLPDKGDFIGLIGNAQAAPIQAAFESAAKKVAPKLPYTSLLVPGAGETIPDTRRSDHVPFWDRGYRGLMLTDTANFRNPHYHEESDRLDTLDIAFITDVARVLAATVIDLCGPKAVSG
ncbi:M28 family peptidase [Nitrospira defluvii]|nr:M28 family peptidase [Nitrospira defluvii]